MPAIKYLKEIFFLIDDDRNKIPFIIRRPMPNGGSEYWKINDLKNLD